MTHLISIEKKGDTRGNEFSLSAEAIVDEYERLEVARHPLFLKLDARPVDLGAVWLLMANLAAGISRDFVIWLAQTIARVEDRRIASLLAKQLNDELGNGSFSGIHSKLLDKFIVALERWRPDGADSSRVLEPGRTLARRASQLFASSSVYEALGALMVGEIFAKKMDHCVGDQIRRQSAISDDDLTWLVIHETLEVDHADDSRELAALVPNDEAALQECRRGARAQWHLLWEFLDGVHAVAARYPS
ncbi:MAG: iron-containing redox enzyme family protein [Myxococcota bacterium]